MQCCSFFKRHKTRKLLKNKNIDIDFLTVHKAKELGYDAGFGPGSFAEDVATFAITELINRKRGEK